VSADTVESSPPRQLFKLPLPSSSAGPAYEVSRDGQRFLVVTSPDTAPRSLTLVVNWPALLKKEATP